MHPHCDADTALDALVRGQDPGDDFWPLKALAADVAVVTSGPAPRPSPALASLLRGAPPAVPAHMRRRSLPARAVAGVTHLGTAARVALGAAVAASGIATAGATGHLPEPVAKAVQPLVDLFTPFGLPADPSPTGAIGLRHGATAGAPAPPPATVVGDPTTPAPAPEAPPDAPVAGGAGEGGGATASQPDNGEGEPLTAPGDAASEPPASEPPVSPLSSPPEVAPSRSDSRPGSQGSGAHPPPIHPTPTHPTPTPPTPTPPTPAPPVPPAPMALGIAPGSPPLNAGRPDGPGPLDRPAEPPQAAGPPAGPPAGSTGGGPAGPGDTKVP
ncbi:MAG TPA: hypothetical protein VFM27_19060 [Acidimicrobiales bacterium]|nr:hypothetical protein [Acidimicrobiales bacterium]